MGEVASSFYFTDNDSKERPPLHAPILPNFSEETDDELSVMLHEFVFNSLAYSGFKQNLW